MFEIENFDVYLLVNVLALILGISFGAIAQKNQFCFSGSIKDYLLTNSTKRAASAILAILVAIIFTNLLASYFSLDLRESIYYKDNINYFTIILGGSLFGAGMMIADGCSSRHLVKFAQGDIHSLITLLFIAIFAYVTSRGILYDAIALLSQNELLISLSSILKNDSLNIYVISAILIVILWLFTKKMKRIFSLYDGLIIGLLVTFGWFITGVIGTQSMEKEIALTSVTFVYPSAKSLEFIMHYTAYDLSFGVSIVFGVLIGAFIMSRFNKKYSFGCTSNLKTSKIKNSMIGGALMGTGGILAIGCTVGQGITGLSSLATASLVAVLSILGSGYVTAFYLNKRKQLPMCFIFEWSDEK